jgi:hypothetical protein
LYYTLQHLFALDQRDTLILYYTLQHLFALDQRDTLILYYTLQHLFALDQRNKIKQWLIKMKNWLHVSHMIISLILASSGLYKTYRVQVHL